MLNRNARNAHKTANPVLTTRSAPDALQTISKPIQHFTCMTITRLLINPTKSKSNQSFAQVNVNLMNSKILTSNHAINALLLALKDALTNLPVKGALLA